MSQTSIVFIIDPLVTLNIKKDSTVAMMQAAQARGWKVGVIEDGGLSWSSHDGVKGHVLWVSVDIKTKPWCTVHEQAHLPLHQVSAVVMRKDPPFDAEFVASSWLLEQAEREGARIFNKPSAIRDHNEKFTIAQFQSFIAPTLVTRQASQAREFLVQYPDAVAKPLDGMGGHMIFRLRAEDPNVGVILETLTAHGSRTAMIQRYIPEITDGDKRVLLIAGKPIPFALARIPKAGEHRGNLAAGGSGRAQPLSEADLTIAHALGPTLHQRGLLLVGLDVIGSTLTEVNVTSPTCFREITDQTGFDVAACFIDAVSASLTNPGHPSVS